MYYIP